jgi:tetratricopeptide (TPR) repeat protein
VALAALAGIALSLPARAVQAPAPVPRPKGTTAQASPAAFEDVARRASAAREANRLEEATRLYREGVGLRPQWDEGWWYLGTLLYDQDQHREAQSAFAKLTALKPDLAPGWAMRGLCEYQLKLYDAALQHIGRGLGLGLAGNESIASVARYHRAALLLRSEQYELALADLTLVARQQGESPGVRNAIGLALLRLAFLPEAVPADKTALVAAVGQAGYYQLAKKLTEAQQAWSAVLVKYPDTPNVHYAYGVYLLPEHPDDALLEFATEAKRDPGHVYSYLQIAFEQLRRNDYAAALPAAEKAVLLAPRLFAAQNALGRALVGAGQLKKGIAALEEAARLAPDSAEMFFSLARAYQKAGRKEDAERARATFAELDQKRKAAQSAALTGESADAAPKPEPAEPR